MTTKSTTATEETATVVAQKDCKSDYQTNNSGSRIMATYNKQQSHY